MAFSVRRWDLHMSVTESNSVSLIDVQPNPMIRTIFAASAFILS